MTRNEKLKTANAHAREIAQIRDTIVTSISLRSCDYDALDHAIIRHEQAITRVLAQPTKA